MAGWRIVTLPALFMKLKFIISTLFLLWTSCSLFEYDDPSDPKANSLPETYLSIMADDTIYQVIDDITAIVDTITGTTVSDTTWTYYVGTLPDTAVAVDTLTHAFPEALTSVQILNWWGEDSDGRVAGYYYKWNVDESWTYTNDESKLFYVPIRTEYDVFSFYVKAVDNSGEWDYESPALSAVDDEFFSDVGDSSNLYDTSDLVLSEGKTPGIQTALSDRLVLVSGDALYLLPPTNADNAVDLTPEFVVLPIKNSKPVVNFRYLSNPQASDIATDTVFTFPTRTFVWDSFDQDGRNSITDLYYALDSTCSSCWTRLDPDISSITLDQDDLSPGFHTFYLKSRDIAGAESDMIQFPDPENQTEPSFWKVREAKGDILIVDDFPQDSENAALNWLSGVIDSVSGDGEFSIWELDGSLPYSPTDMTESLKFFDHVIWNGAYTGQELYDEASTSIHNFVLSGGNFFISVPNIADTSFVWFPIDSIADMNRQNRFLLGDRTLHSQVPGAPDLRTDDNQGIFVLMRTFENGADHPGFTPLYRLPEPVNSFFDEWEGTPTVAGIHDFPQTPGSGKSVLLTIPLHNGYFPLLDGNDNMIEFFNYLINELFME